jgi:ribonuclease VapC
MILEEEGHVRLVEAVAGADNLAIGAPTLVETGIIMIASFNLRGRALVAQFLEHNQVVVIPFDGRHWGVAAEAFIRYGKGRHPAALNYGDCMTYATARLADHSLLFTGDGFAKTDIAVA